MATDDTSPRANCAHHGASGARRAGYLEDDVHRLAVGRSKRVFGQIFFGRIEGRETEAGADFPSRRARLRYVDIGSRPTGDDGYEQADRSATENEHVLAGSDPPASNVVTCNCQRLDQRGIPEAAAPPDAVHDLCGDIPKIPEATVGIQSEESEPAADMRVASVAGDLA